MLTQFGLQVAMLGKEGCTEEFLLICSFGFSFPLLLQAARLLVL